MKFLLSSLQLASLCALSSYSVSSEPVVTQSEDVAVKEGETAEIYCCSSNMYERAAVVWRKMQKEVQHEILNKTVHSKEVKKELLNNTACSYLKMTNLTKEDSGTYICEVSAEIPVFSRGSGNGTVITVLPKSEPEEDKGNKGNGTCCTPLSLGIGLAVTAPILLFTLICFCVLRRRRDQALRVIYEVPHFDSETQDELDKTSSGSRGSSQWCQVPVYESFDYFEPGEAKKSG